MNDAIRRVGAMVLAAAIQGALAPASHAGDCPNVLPATALFDSDPSATMLLCAPPCVGCSNLAGVALKGPYDVVATGNLQDGTPAGLTIKANPALLGALPLSPCANERIVGAYFVWTWPVSAPGCDLLVDVSTTIGLVGDQVNFAFQSMLMLPRCVTVQSSVIPFKRPDCAALLKPDGCAPLPSGVVQDAVGFFVRMPRMGRHNSAWLPVAANLNAGLDVAGHPDLTVKAALPPGATVLSAQNASRLYFVTQAQPQWGDLMLVSPKEGATELDDGERGIVFRNSNDDSGIAGVPDLMEADQFADKMQRPGAIPDVLFDQVMMGNDPVLTAEFPYLKHLDPQLMAVVIDMSCDWSDLEAVRITAGADPSFARLWLCLDVDGDQKYDLWAPQSNVLELDENAGGLGLLCNLVGQPFVEQTICETTTGWGQPLGLFIEALAIVGEQIVLTLEGRQGGNWITFDRVALDVIGVELTIGSSTSPIFSLPTLQGYGVPTLGSESPCDDSIWQVDELSMIQLASLQRCFGDPSGGGAPDCQQSDFDCDGDVDADDFLSFCESPLAQPCDLESRLLPVAINIPTTIIELRTNPILGLLAPDNMQWVVRRPGASGSPTDPRFVSIESFPSADFQDPVGEPWPGYQLVGKSYFKLHVVAGMDTRAWYTADGILSNLYLAHSPAITPSNARPLDKEDSSVTALIGMCGPVTAGTTNTCDGSCCRTDDTCCDEDASPCLTCVPGDRPRDSGSGKAQWVPSISVSLNETTAQTDDFVPLTQPSTPDRPFRILTLLNKGDKPANVTLESAGDGLVTLDPTSASLAPQVPKTIKVYGEQASSSENTTRIEVKSGGKTCVAEDLTVVTGVKVKFGGTFMFMVSNNNPIIPVDPADPFPPACDGDVLWQATPLGVENLGQYNLVYFDEGAPQNTRWSVASGKRVPILVTVMDVKTFGPSVNLNNRDPAIKQGVVIHGTTEGAPGAIGLFVTDDCDNDVNTPACPPMLECPFGGRNDGPEPVVGLAFSIGDSLEIKYVNSSSSTVARIWTKFPTSSAAAHEAQDLMDAMTTFFPNFANDPGPISPDMTYYDDTGVLKCGEPLSVYQLFKNVAGFRGLVKEAWANWTSRRLVASQPAQANSSFIAKLFRDIARGHPVNLNGTPADDRDAEAFMQFGDYDWYTHMGTVSKGVVATPNGIDPMFIQWTQSQGCPVPYQPTIAKGADPFN